MLALGHDLASILDRDGGFGIDQGGAGVAQGDLEFRTVELDEGLVGRDATARGEGGMLGNDADSDLRADGELVLEKGKAGPLF